MERCLETLGESADFRAAEQREAVEVIVVDNDASAASAEQRNRMASVFPRVTFVANGDNPGFAHACNTGVRHARGSLLLFLNPDVTAHWSDVERLRDEMQALEANIVAPEQIGGRGRRDRVFDRFPTPLNSFGSMRALLRILSPGRYPDPRAPREAPLECDWVTGAALMISARDLETLGGWNESFWMYMEDVDLCRRARAHRMRVCYTPRVRFTHLHGAASRVDERTEVLTRSEVVVSRHLYVSLHFSPGRALWFHTVLAVKTLLSRFPAVVADLLTLHQVRALRVRSRVWAMLVRHYVGAVRRRSWLEYMKGRGRSTSEGRTA